MKAWLKRNDHTLLLIVLPVALSEIGMAVAKWAA
jgi:hypothetical protein